MFKHLACAVALLSVAYLHVAHADEYDEEYKRVGSAKTITAYGSDIFGDKVNIYNGGLEFVQQDVSLLGNNALPVAAGRRRTLGERLGTATDNPLAHSMIGSWRFRMFTGHLPLTMEGG